MASRIFALLKPSKLATTKVEVGNVASAVNEPVQITDTSGSESPDAQRRRATSIFYRQSVAATRARSRTLWEIEDNDEENNRFQDDGLDEQAHESLLAVDNWKRFYKNRDRWESRVDFDVATLAAGIGLGNIWKLALVLFENGKGAFLVPYIICVCFLAAPLYFTEASLGQFSTSGPVKVWDMAPICRGVGFSTMAVLACTSGFYSAITALCFHYMTKSFFSPLPWATCNVSEYLTHGRFIFANFTCQGKHGVHYYTDTQNGKTIVRNLTVGSEELYLRYAALHAYDNLDSGLGLPESETTVELLCVWIMVYATVMTGTRSMSRGAYLQSLLPCLILFLLFLKSFIYEGAVEGIQQFFTPEWEKLASPELWHDALNQAFFTLANGFGVHMVLNSYNPFRQKSYKETIMLTWADTFVTLTAGMTISASVGAVAKSRKSSIQSVIMQRKGSGLAFVTYPELLSSFSAQGLPQVYSALFFAMLVALGVGTMAGYMMSLMGCIFDIFPWVGTRMKYRIVVTFLVCLVLFGSGLLLVTPGGYHLQSFMLAYVTEVLVFVVIFYEAFGIFYVYGIRNVIVDLRFLYNLEGTLARLFLNTYQIWAYIMPWLMLAFVTHVLYYEIASGSERKIRTHYKQYSYPPFMTYVAVGIVICMIAITPVTAFIVVLTSKGNGWREKLATCMQPSASWGPKNVSNKADWILYRMVIQGCTFGAGMHGTVATRRHRVRMEDIARLHRRLASITSEASQAIPTVGSLQSIESSDGSLSQVSL